MRFEGGLLSGHFADDGMAALSKKYVTALVRVPEAYKLVRKYGAARPGIMILDPGASDDAVRRWASIAIRGGATDLARAKKYLGAALTAKEPVAPDHERTALRASDLRAAVGYYVVFQVTPDSPAAKLGLRRGDKLRSIGGKAITRFGGARAILAKGGELEWIFARADGTLITTKLTGPLQGVKLAFSMRPPAAAPKKKPAPEKPEPKKPEPKRYY